MKDKQRPVLGWREWLALPDIGLPGIKAKVDTGARTSALHAFCVEPYLNEGRQFVRFHVHPLPGNNDLVRVCQAEVIDNRRVTDSGGHVENRFVIHTTAVIADIRFPIELTLTNRDTMKFRMLLGRAALKQIGAMVAPDRSYQMGPSLRHAYELSEKENNA
ncbi:MAG TPA: ATP-dependent zinc protease [Geopsychrobacteraceae bacterium]|nr:ATP-dependent zinc protease [Geopsychrobacteraceae bacterium]